MEELGIACYQCFSGRKEGHEAWFISLDFIGREGTDETTKQNPIFIPSQDLQICGIAWPRNNPVIYLCECYF